MIRSALFAAVIAVLPLSAQADDRVTLGWGRMFDNDALGDLHDRWQSGSYTISLMRGTDWSGTLPTGFGDLLEYRFYGATITAANLANPAADDRRYVAPLSFGLHSHFDWRGIETSVGIDLVSLGPQTGVSRFQSWLHGALGVDKPDLSDQIGNGLSPTMRAELGRSFALSDTVTLRPFVAAEAGVETMVRAGGDIQIGSFGKAGLMLRDGTTGQRYRGISGDRITGMTFSLGGDVARVFSSDLLPDGGPAVASDTRTRLRAGIAWQGQRSSAFYGVTYLSPEFDSQPTGQLVGSVNINLRF
ncbi:MAG: lipid A-modifier LpxR family protein [bacterium]